MVECLFHGAQHFLHTEQVECSIPPLTADVLLLPSETMTTATSPILLKWDPKSLEIRTLTVERLLEPLVTQVGPSETKGYAALGFKLIWMHGCLTVQVPTGSPRS